ncbi:MAG: ROK family protein [Candidatus Dormibacteraeota bacterium]|nr:ROK family protein [Candidatus Dormibacteraeota bacterium]
MTKLVAGIDLGGTKIQTVILRQHEIVGKCRVATPQTGAEAVLAAMAESVKGALQSGGEQLNGLKAVGVGSPGVIQGTTVASSPNVPGFEVGPIPMGDELSRGLGGVDVDLDNDVRVAVLGEWRQGSGRPFKDFLGVFVGTGVGGGLVLDGELREGLGAAGEIGHTLVKDGGRNCGCGMLGHLEAYAGRRSMEDTARRWKAKGRRTKLFKIMKKKGRPVMTSGVWAEALEHHDELAVELIDRAVAALAAGVASAVNLLDVEAVVFGGGLGTRLGTPYIGRIEQQMQPHLFVDTRPPAVHLAALGDLSGAIGAALLVKP